MTKPTENGMPLPLLDELAALARNILDDGARSGIGPTAYNREVQVIAFGLSAHRTSDPLVVRALPGVIAGIMEQAGFTRAGEKNLPAYLPGEFNLHIMHHASDVNGVTVHCHTTAARLRTALATPAADALRDLCRKALREAINPAGLSADFNTGKKPDPKDPLASWGNPMPPPRRPG